MKRVLTGLAAVLAGVLAAAAWAAAADDKKDAKGWVQLFDGKDLIGWKIHGQPNPRDIVRIYPKIEGGKPVAYEGQLKKSDKVVPLWRVEDGILIGSGPSTHLFSDRGDYENFYFRVEVMINDHGNSGQYFRTKFGPGFPKGYEAQINATHGDKIRSGSLYPSFNPPKEDRKKIIVYDQLVKPDEWYTQEVMADGNHIVIKVNGKTTVDYVDPNNTYTKGHFALQGHDPGTVVKFRKIEVKELPSGSR